MTRNREIVITEYDFERLQKLVEDEQYNAANAVKRTDLKDLAKELGRAQLVKPSKLAADVITMNSVVELLDLETDEELSVTLVFPRGRLRSTKDQCTSAHWRRRARPPSWRPDRVACTSWGAAARGQGNYLST